MERHVADLKWKVIKHMAAGDFEEAAKALYYDVSVSDVVPELKMSGAYAKRLRDMMVDRAVPAVQKWQSVLELFSPMQATDELWDMTCSHVLGPNAPGARHNGSLLRPKTGLRSFYEVYFSFNGLKNVVD